MLYIFELQVRHFATLADVDNEPLIGNSLTSLVHEAASSTAISPAKNLSNSTVLEVVSCTSLEHEAGSSPTLVASHLKSSEYTVNKSQLSDAHALEKLKIIIKRKNDELKYLRQKLKRKIKKMESMQEVINELNKKIRMNDEWIK